MDLLLKVGILIVVLIVIFSAVFLIFVHSQQSGPVTQQQAESLVLNDIKSQNPTATVAIVSVSPSTLVSGSWNIVLSVVYNATRPCPTLFIQGYDYPATGLVNSTANLYTRGCIIYGLSTAPTYVISSPYVAIARSYSSNSVVLNSYVNMYGYNNVNVYATFYANLTSNSLPANTTYNNVWLIKYTTPKAPIVQDVVLDQSGQIIANFTS